MKWYDKVAELSPITGTGAIPLAGAIDGYRAFSAVMTIGDTACYAVTAVDDDGIPTGEWETGIGTYSSINTLTRTSVSQSSNGNSLVDFTVGQKRVTLSVIASQVVEEAPLTGGPYGRQGRAWTEVGGGGGGGGSGFSWITTATGTGAAQNIFLPYTGLLKRAVFVFIDGAKLPVADYTILDNVISLTAPSGADIEIFGPAGSSDSDSPLIRSFAVQRFVGSSVSIPLPTAEVGDTAVLAVGQAYTVDTISGWESVVYSGGTNVNYRLMTKTLTADDITAGSVTATLGGSFDGSYQIVILAGPCTVRTQGVARNEDGAAAHTVSTAASVADEDKVLTFSHVRGNTAINYSRGTKLGAVAAGQSSGALAAETITTPGAFSNGVTFPTSNDGVVSIAAAFYKS